MSSEINDVFIFIIKDYFSTLEHSLETLATWCGDYSKLQGQLQKEAG